MLNASAFALALQAEPQAAEPMRLPLSFMTIVLVLLVGGAVGWLVAAVLGFSRARAFGPSTRWFAFSALCLLLYHIQWFAWVVFGFNQRDRDAMERVIYFGGFFNLFILLGSICAIIGFVQLNKNTDD
ncbi:MAG TPA: hypothetical protein VF240_16620 [Pyrinomonadaceae bacterium]